MNLKQCQTVPKQCQTSVCSATPRFSYTGPETVICACPGGPETVPAMTCDPCGVPGWYQGGYNGWVYRWGTGRAIPDAHRQGPSCSRRCSDPAERARRLLQGAGVVGSECRTSWDRSLGASVRPCTHPCGARSVSPAGSPPWYRTSLLGQRARFHYISHKVSQNGKVSPKSVEKAYVSP